jgi:AraC family transcriptional regulator of adaptative response/methylated-DNA-[protein]-cysteine methyltransferase
MKALLGFDVQNAVSTAPRHAYHPNMPSLLFHALSREEMLAAMQSSDSAYEGVFFTSVRTTGIFCRPTCPARKPKPENVVFHASADAALADGFRPCKRCHPLSLPREAPEWVALLLDALRRQPDHRWGDPELQALGLDPVRVRRWFKEHHGQSFQRWWRAHRLGSALGALPQTSSVDAGGFDHGFDSVSGFRAAFGRQFATTPGRAKHALALRYASIETPLGPMLAAAEDRGLVLLEFLDRPALVKELEELRDRHDYLAAPGEHPHFGALREQLKAFFAGARREFDVPLHLPGTAFEQSVWAALRSIPSGETRSYGELAAALGQPGAARAVGAANGRNRVAILVPCHRVVGQDGRLTGYGGGLRRKQKLLELEGVSVADGRLGAQQALWPTSAS